MGIEDAEIAFAFDLQCNEILTEWEMDREKRMLEAASLGAAENQLPPELKIMRQ